MAHSMSKLLEASWRMCRNSNLVIDKNWSLTRCLHSSSQRTCGLEEEMAAVYARGPNWAMFMPSGSTEVGDQFPRGQESGELGRKSGMERPWEEDTADREGTANLLGL